MLFRSTTLSAIDEKRALRGELPLEVQDLEDDIAGLLGSLYLNIYIRCKDSIKAVSYTHLSLRAPSGNCMVMQWMLPCWRMMVCESTPMISRSGKAS